MTAGIGGGSVDHPAHPAHPAHPVDPAHPVASVAPRVVPPRTPARTLADRLLDGADFGVLSVDERGLVRRANAAARRLLPGLREAELLPGPVAAGLTGGPDDGPAELELGGRALRARRQELPDGWVAWHVEDVTEHRRRLDNLLAERARSRFLATASRRLGLSLHPGRTARAVVELASSELADLAVVVLPVRGGVSEWFACTGDRVARSGRTDVADMPAELRDALAGIATGPRPLLAEDLAGQPWAAGSTGAPAAAALISLPGNGVPAGALVLLRHEADSAAAPGVDQALTEEFAQRSGLALAAASLCAGQAGTAAVLKRSLQQPELPRLPGMAFGAADGGLELELAGGGHLPPLVVRRDGVEEVEIGGMLVGAVPGARFASRTVRLAPGEACVLCTDGVSEARGGVDGRETLGETRLAALLAGAHVMPAPAIAERVEQHTTRWLASGAHDDIAVLVVQAPLALPAPAVEDRP
ncbi:serine/threonine-protein phosphatase [Pseudonocardia sp. RS11V-5]|uniref:PP2C family protein-serine/threonine phosphatase n=1 Tax=Pseudonocardia terrae TaxID=2905831 RepID=UPI001E5E106B|nr:PP2C family protein-serine/threonine phosphatase [Pseudonocardia terrae]MCE3553614.1 serine/threonine-protein phosphatase [Pseudonocardia terrae]